MLFIIHNTVVKTFLKTLVNVFLAQIEIILGQRHTLSDRTMNFIWIESIYAL